MKYKHISQVERYQIHALINAGHNRAEIAKLLDQLKSTISLDLIRNIGSSIYRPEQACELTA
jgi:IS30 family transposase